MSAARQAPIFVVLTGGPCAGKTTMLKVLSEMRYMAGRRMLFVPESATTLMDHGFGYEFGAKVFQTAVLRLQFALEDTAREYALACPEPALIIADRGTLDGAAYCEPGEFDEIMLKFNVTEKLLLARYDGVIHLESSAVGAEEFYSGDSNAVRIEKDTETARKHEAATLEAWKNFPDRVIVPSGIAFGEKMAATISAITDVVKNLDELN